MNSEELYEILSLSKQDTEELIGFETLSKRERIDRIKDWTTLFRRNSDIFVRDYLGIKLKPYQELMLRCMDDSDISVNVMSRGIGKSYVVALKCLKEAFLYPNQNILLTSETIAQSNKIIDEKIDRLFSTEGTMFSSPILCQLRKDEYMVFRTDQSSGGRIIEFGNGSKIFAVSSGESARSNRSTTVVVDEFARVDETVYNRIIEPTLEPRRFAGRPADYPEETRQIFLTSARNKTNWAWRRLVDAVNGHYKEDDVRYGFFIGDIFTAVANGIQTKQQYLQRKRNTDDMSFQQEYLNIFLGNNEDSIFKYEDFEKNQVVHNAFTPLNREDVLDGKEQSWKFGDNEIRWLTTDLAVATGDDNDNTVIILSKLNLDTRQKTEEYIEVFNGMNSIEQVLMMKRLFYDYKCDYMVMDSKGLGNTIFDLLTVETFDPMMNKTYPAWTVNTDEVLQISSDTVINDKIERTMTKGAKEVVIPYAGTSELNSNGHLALRKALKDGEISLLIDDYDKKAELEKQDINYFTKEAEEKSVTLLPHLQTRFMINEAISLEVKFMDTGNIKLSEAKRTDTKDRYMTLMMCNYFGDKLINKYCSDDSLDDFDLDDFQLVF